MFDQEALRLQDIMGASFAIVGGFLIIQFSTQFDDILNARQIVYHLGDWQFIIYMFVEVIGFGLIIFLRSYNTRLVLDQGFLMQKSTLILRLSKCRKRVHFRTLRCTG